MGLQRIAVDHIDRPWEQGGDGVLEPGIGENIERGGRVELDHDVNIAVWPRLPPRDGAEDCGMPDPSRAQAGLVPAENGNGLVAGHGCI